MNVPPMVLKSSKKVVVGKDGHGLPPKTFAQCAKEAKIPKVVKECANWKNGTHPSFECAKAVNLSDTFSNRFKWMPNLNKCMKVPSRLRRLQETKNAKPAKKATKAKPAKKATKAKPAKKASKAKPAKKATKAKPAKKSTKAKPAKKATKAKPAKSTNSDELARVKNYGNASAGLDINAPVNEMKRKHRAYRKSLSGVVVAIQHAFDGAKKNNKRAVKLHKDENDSLKSVQAALVAVRGEKAKSTAIRKDKQENFPPLPKHVTAHFKSIK